MSVQTSRQPWEQDVLAADSAFFTALVEGDGQALDRVLADQFVLVGVKDGAVVPREAPVALVDQGQLRFDAIQADGSAVLLRRYGSTAIIVGRTRDAWQLCWGDFPGDEPLYPRVRRGSGRLAAGFLAGHADRR